MAAKKGSGGIAVLFQGAGFLFAAVLVMHLLFILTGFAGDGKFVGSVAQAAEPLALFFPGLLSVDFPVLQVLLDYGLAACFWVLVGGLLGRVFG
ncbi:hypothetical protein SAMN05421805_11985 [Saccharopolyspora antimicrobica]|uniref:YGGT family protein n=2 Tax=Saccharopolyspora TaxID=1835 RepID=A0A1I5IQK5_9PSEU|nr:MULTISPECIES: hypothetical protein [Saccharopolyspora]RKT84105.1 hypothetical protein ATL45_2406 [Saccharopolyspora antimicrobica]SEG83365.1 hypothetical protein SAMN02982929_04245 [Saccharopolyspora kobensis]SFE30487.1 hypothetical protein SAMN05216506_110162 [Saccharopolyspora kobensis]SFO62610.1 hypothetical protein SAMN05421805_11985 [Saccharopolyspora antimicrobica]